MAEELNKGLKGDISPERALEFPALHSSPPQAAPYDTPRSTRDLFA